MKLFHYIITLTLLSCNNQPGETSATTNTDTLNYPATTKSDKSKYYTTKDTLLIITERDDTLKYGKAEFNEIIDKNPELTDDYIQHPDQAYACKGFYDRFGSEAGQDTYYILYAYLLKQANGIDKYAEHRKKLINIYTNINSIFQQFQYGGTYFGHQYARILGYAEFSVYLYKQIENNVSKTYDVTKQKVHYIKSLRQLIEDESRIDLNLAGQAKVNRNKELNAMVDQLDKLITDNFYLRRAQEFHYAHYEYY